MAEQNRGRSNENGRPGGSRGNSKPGGYGNNRGGNSPRPYNRDASGGGRPPRRDAGPGNSGPRNFGPRTDGPRSNGPVDPRNRGPRPEGGFGGSRPYGRDNRGDSRGRPPGRGPSDSGPGEFRRPDSRGPDSRGPRSEGGPSGPPPYGRDDQSPRPFNRPSDRPDRGGDRGGERGGDRGGRFNPEDRRPYGGNGGGNGGGYESRAPRRDRDDRGPRPFHRDDRRPEGGGNGPRPDRDDRGPRPFNRDDRPGNAGFRPGPRPDGGERGPRPFNRDDRGPRPFNREDRGGESGPRPGGFDADRPQRPYGDRPSGRPEARGGDRFDRNRGPWRDDRRDEPQAPSTQGPLEFPNFRQRPQPGADPERSNWAGRARMPDPIKENEEVRQPRVLKGHDAEFSEALRLHVRIAHSGLCSRRAAEQLILDGRVQVNGEFVHIMGTKVGPDDTIKVDGMTISTARIYTVVLNKPTGVVSTLLDPQRRPTIVSYLPDYGVQLKPVGRLDMDTEGLLLCSNDGDLAARITHPRYGMEKEYLAIVEGIVDDRAIDKMREGVYIEGGKTSPANVELIHAEPKANTTSLRITVHEGRKRQVRQMCDAVGYPVRSLKRVRIGPLILKGMRAGEARLLGKKEVDTLRQLVGLPPLEQ